MNARETLRVNERGHLEIGGADCTGWRNVSERRSTYSTKRISVK
ncbi:MAG: hypothetical protein ACLRSW_09990 [Christensenellaceae bacterium]